MPKTKAAHGNVAPKTSPARKCNEARHLYEGDCCAHGSRCPCHVHDSSKLFRDHSGHVYEWMVNRYAEAELDLEPGTRDYARVYGGE